MIIIHITTSPFVNEGLRFTIFLSLVHIICVYIFHFILSALSTPYFLSSKNVVYIFLYMFQLNVFPKVSYLVSVHSPVLRSLLKLIKRYRTKSVFMVS